MTQITIPNAAHYVSYSVVSASTGPFTVPFPFFDNEDVKCTVTDALGAVTNLVYLTDFVFASRDVPVGQEGNGYLSGTITLNSSIGADGATTLYVYRDSVIDRTANFPNTGPFSVALLNDEFNREFAILQEIDKNVSDVDARITTNASGIATNVVNIASNASAISGLISTPGSTPLYPISAAETAAGVTPADYSYPVGYVERYGGAGDDATDNKAAIDNAILACQGTGVPIVFGAGIYRIVFADGTSSRYLDVIDDLTVQGSGRTTTTLRYYPDDADFLLRGWLVSGVNFECRDLTVTPPVQTNIATTLFDDLPDVDAFYLDVGPALNARIERVNVTQGFSNAVKGFGDGSNGWKIFLKDCTMAAYSVVVSISNSDDSVANDALRELWIHDQHSTGHNNEGPDWNDRGRVHYIHPHISCDYRNVYAQGSGRVHFAQYSSGSVVWNSHPPRYMNFLNCRAIQPAGWPDGENEGIQTTNLVGTVSNYTDCVIDVANNGLRVRSNTVFKGCHFRGSTLESKASEAGAIKTYINTAGVATDTTVTLEDGSIFSDTDPIYLWMDDNTLFQTTVSGAPAGNVVTLADPLPSGIAVGRWVIQSMFSSFGANGNTTEWIKFIGCTFSNDCYPGAMLLGQDRVDIYVQDCVIDLDIATSGGNTDFYHNLSTKDARLFSKNNIYRSRPGQFGYVAEMEGVGLGEAHFDGDVFEGEGPAPFLFADANRITFNNCISYLDVATGSFSIGALPVGVLTGANNKYYGTAKEHRTVTGWQGMAPGKGLNPVNVTNAATLVLDLNYDVHNVTGAGTVTNMLHENDAVSDLHIAGRVTLISLTGMTLTHGGRMIMPGGVNKVLAAGEAFDVVFDPSNNKIIGIG